MMTLYKTCWDESRCEIVNLKAFLAVCGDKYRSHYDTIYRFAGGCWRTGQIEVEDIELMNKAARLASAIVIKLKSVPGLSRSSFGALLDVGWIFILS